MIIHIPLFYNRLNLLGVEKPVYFRIEISTWKYQSCGDRGLKINCSFLISTGYKTTTKYEEYS